MNIFQEKYNLDNFNDPKLIQFKNIDIHQLPNIIFCGEPSVGKTTQIYAMLSSFFDDKVYNSKHNTIEIEKRVFKFRSSIYHIEIDCIDLLNNEKIFIQQYLKEYVQTKNIGLDKPKIIYFINPERISSAVFLSLRKLIEDTYQSAKYIFEVTNIYKIPSPIQSRCSIVRLRRPKKEEILSNINNILKKNKLKLSASVVNKIMEKEIYYRGYYYLFNIYNGIYFYCQTKKFIVNQFYNCIDDILRFIHLKNLNAIKELSEKSYVNCIDFFELIFVLNNCLLRKYPDHVNEIINQTVLCEKALNHCTSKYFIHLENYIMQIIIIVHNLYIKEKI